MSKCIRCGNKTFRKRICSNCMAEWLEMRRLVFNALIKKYKGLKPDTYAQFKSETKALEKLWRKDKELFKLEMFLLNENE